MLRQAGPKDEESGWALVAGLAGLCMSAAVAGCTYVSDEPLIDAETADFPFVAITVGTTDNLGESLTFVRRGDSYTRFDSLGPGEAGYLLTRIVEPIYVVQLPGNSYTALELDLDANKWGMFDPPVPDGELPSGLSRCRVKDRSKICVSSLGALTSLVLASTAKRSSEETREIPWVSQRIGTLQEGLRAFRDGRLAEALTILRPLAAEGVVEAQVALGNTFYVLDDPTADEKAVAMYKVAAQAGDPAAQNNLGVMYEKGRGIDQDFDSAAKWYRLAEAQGNEQAKKNLKDLWTAAPVSWSRGLSLPASHRWVQVASRMNLDEAIAIGEKYAAQRSRVVASRNKWFAVVLGPIEATDLDDFRALYAGPALPGDAWLTSGANYKATIWAPGSDEALLVRQQSVRSLCAYALNSAKVDWDDRPMFAEHAAEAARWRLTVSLCRSSLGLPELPSEIVRREVEKTRGLAEAGDAKSQNILGNMYLHGQGVPLDEAEAVKWFQRAAEQGHADSQFDLAFMYANGRGIEEDEAEALRWYRRAAEQGHDEAQVRLTELERKLASERLLAPREVGPTAILYEEPLDKTGASLGVAAYRAQVAWSYLPNGINGPEIVGNVDVPERALKLKIAIRRNTDVTLPASHIVEVVVDAPADFPGGGVRDVPRVVFKPSEDARGQPLIGASARVADGFFWIALSGIPADVNRNVGLLRDYAWIDLPLVYENGQRAILTLEKGRDGQTVFERAFAAWADLPQTSPPKQPDRGTRVSAMSMPALCSLALNVTRSGWDARPVYAPYIVEAKRRGLSLDDCRAAMEETRVRPTQTVRPAREAAPVVLPPSPTKPAAAPQQPTEFTNGGVVVRVSRCRNESPCRQVGSEEEIEVKGDFEEGDEQIFINALLALKQTKVSVSLSSDGGSLWAGIRIGEEIRLRGYSTWVPGGQTCASACALAWIGGHARYMASDKSVGFHAAYDANDEQLSPSAPANAVVGAYLTRLGHSIDTVIYVTEAPPREMRWLSFSDAAKIGLEVGRFAP